MIEIGISALVDFFKDPILDALKELKEEGKYYLDNGLKPYLDSQRKKFIKTKTFLHRHDTVNFYKVFYPITLSSYKKTAITTKSVSELFSFSKYITVIGNAGSGKSMLMKHLFLNSIKEKYKIPVFIELRHLNSFDGSLFDYINDRLLQNKLSPNEKILTRILRKGHFVFLFDGYDELFSGKKEKVTSEINNFIDLYKDNRFIISSRPGADVELLPRFKNLYVNKLKDDDVFAFIDKQLTIFKNQDNSELAERMKETISDPNNRSYKIFLRNPLLLSMFILTFENNPEIPKKRSRFYANVFNALCIQHNALSKYGFSHEKRSGLNNDQIENVLKILSFVTYFRGEYSFEHSELRERLRSIDKNAKSALNFESEKLIADLRVSIPILIKDGLEYKFPHRSLQEYFTALFISELEPKQKENIYNTQLRDLASQGVDSYQNFWSLCLELDRTAFLEHFVLYTLKNFLKQVDTTSEETIIESIFDVIDLQLILEFYRYLAYDDYSGNRLGKRTNYKGGMLRESKWSEEFTYNLNLFKFLNFDFRIYNVTEKAAPEDILAHCSETSRADIARLTYSEEVDEDLTLSTEEFNENSREITEEAEIYPVVINKHLSNRKTFARNTGIGEILLKLYHEIVSKAKEIEGEIDKDITFSDDIIKSLFE